MNSAMANTSSTLCERSHQITGASNNGLHQTRRGGAVASRPVVVARLAGEAECSLYQARSPIEITTARIGWMRQS